MENDWNTLHEIIKSVWMDIETDYNNGCILNEDTLKNAFYFHLRTALAQGEEYADYRIFTECTDFGFSDHNKRPDMIVARITPEKSTGKRIEIQEQGIVAIIEFKYKSEKCAYVCEEVMHDFEKIRAYHRENGWLLPDCHFYIAAITLGDFTKDAWVYDKRTLENWAKGHLTELIAYEPDGKLEFTLIEHGIH